MNIENPTSANKRMLIRRAFVGGSVAVAILTVAAAVLFTLILPGAGRAAHAATLSASSAGSSGGGGGCFVSGQGVCSFKGVSATAGIESSTACVATTVFVFASEGVTHTPPAPPTSAAPDVEMLIQQYVVDPSNPACAGAQVIDGYSDGFTGTVQTSDGGHTFSVSGTIEVFDLNSPSDIPLSVTFTWQSIDQTSRTIDSFHTISPQCLFGGQMNATTRDALVSGAVLNGTTNLTPDPMVGGDLMDVSSGTIQLGCQ